MCKEASKDYAILAIGLSQGIGAVAGAAVMPDLQELDALCVKALAALVKAARRLR